MGVLLPDTCGPGCAPGCFSAFWPGAWLFCILDSASPAPLAFWLKCLLKDRLPVVPAQLSVCSVGHWAQARLFWICRRVVLPLALQHAPLTGSTGVFYGGCGRGGPFCPVHSSSPGGCRAREIRRRSSRWGLRAEGRGWMAPLSLLAAFDCRGGVGSHH